MATVAPPRERNPWEGVFEAAGQAIGGAYEKHVERKHERADDMAIQNALSSLPPGASAEDMVRAITKVKLYNKGRGKELITTYAGAKEVDEAIRKNKETEEINKQKNALKEQENAIKENAANAKIEAEKNKAEAAKVDAAKTYQLAYPGVSFEEALKQTEGASPASVRALVAKPENVTDYEVAKNFAKPYEPEVEHYGKKSIEAKNQIPSFENAILLNESYEGFEKFGDQIIDTLSSVSPFFETLKSTKGQELQSIMPLAISSLSEKMGGQLTKARQQLIEKKAAGPARSKEANRMFLYMDLFSRKLDVFRDQFSKEIIRENKYGLPPKDFDEQLAKKMRPIQKQMAEDMERLANGQKPISPFAQLERTQKFKGQLKPGEVLVVGPGSDKVFALPKEALSMPEYSQYKEVE